MVRQADSSPNEALKKMIPSQYQVTLKDEPDFVFQINRPRKSRAVKDITVNCITKWSAERLQVTAILAPAIGVFVPTNGGMQPQIQHTKEFIAASIAIDSNNAPSATALASDQQSALLLEGLAETVEMLREVGANIEGF
jgi:hypothetical protein